MVSYQFFQDWEEFTLKERIVFILTLFMKIVVFVILFLSIYLQRWFVVFVSILFLFFSFLPAMIKKRFKIHLPLFFDFTLGIFLFASLILGEVTQFYYKYWWWDIFLHSFSAIVLGMIGFIIIFSLRFVHKVKISPILVMLFSFTFALALGAFWEILEFFIDFIFGTNMQKSGLLDTMSDLIIDFIGALIVSILGFVYIKLSERRLVKHLRRHFRIGKYSKKKDE